MMEDQKSNEMKQDDRTESLNGNDAEIPHADVPSINEQTGISDSDRYAFHWEYTEPDGQMQDAPSEKEKSHKGSRGLLSFSILILALSILVSALLTANPAPTYTSGGTVSNGYVERVVYVNGDGDAEEALAVEAAVAKMLPSAVSIIVTTSRGGSGVGSGVILSSDGYIATNHHVVSGKDTITVRLYGGKRYAAELVGSDPIADLALLKISATDLVPAEWGDSSTLLIGETVMAIGTPTGLSYSETVTRGIVSCQSRAVKYMKEDGTLDYTLMMVQTDASVNPGNSGGALIDRSGTVIGIVANKAVFHDNGSTYYADGMGLAIPANAAKQILEALKSGTEPDRSSFLVPAARLGISGKNVSLETGHSVSGVLVTGHNGDAFDASRQLLVGDIITKVDGLRIAGIAELLTILEDYTPGATIVLTVMRNETEVTVSAILGSDAMVRN